MEHRSNPIKLKIIQLVVVAQMTEHGLDIEIDVFSIMG